MDALTSLFTKLQDNKKKTFNVNQQYDLLELFRNFVIILFIMCTSFYSLCKLFIIAVRNTEFGF